MNDGDVHVYVMSMTILFLLDFLFWITLERWIEDEGVFFSSMTFFFHCR